MGHWCPRHHEIGDGACCGGLRACGWLARVGEGPRLSGRATPAQRSPRSDLLRAESKRVQRGGVSAREALAGLSWGPVWRRFGSVRCVKARDRQAGTWQPCGLDLMRKEDTP